MRILIAEDEKDLNHILVQKLTQDGYSVDNCYDGQEAMDILCKADIPAGAVLDCDDITKDEYLRKRGMMVELDSRARGKLVIPGLPTRMSENHVEYQDAPKLGENNEDIYKGVLGLTDGEIKALKDKKVI